MDLVEVEDPELMRGAGLGAVFIVRGRQSRGDEMRYARRFNFGGVVLGT